MVTSCGRAPKGERLHAPAPLHAQNVSVIGAIGISEVREIGMVDGTLNAIAVEKFIEDILLKKLKSGDILILDTAPTHNMKKIQLILDRVNARVLPLPPYSPDFSPIEMLWSKVKGIIMDLSP